MTPRLSEPLYVLSPLSRLVRGESRRAYADREYAERVLARAKRRWPDKYGIYGVCTWRTVESVAKSVPVIPPRKDDWPDQDPATLSPAPWFAVREGFDPSRFLIVGPAFNYNGTSECDIAENLTEADARAIVEWRNADCIVCRARRAETAAP